MYTELQTSNYWFRKGCLYVRCVQNCCFCT